MWDVRSAQSDTPQVPREHGAGLIGRPHHGRARSTDQAGGTSWKGDVRV